MTRSKESNFPELAEELQNKFYIAEDTNKAFDWKRKKNLALYLGDQWAVFDEDSDTIRRVKPDPTETRITVNLIRKNIESRIAQITGEIPRFNVIPNSEEESDVYKANIARKALRVIWDKHKLVDLRESVERTKELLCDAWVEVGWNWNKGRIIKDIIETTEDTGEPILNDDGTQKTDSKGRPLFYKKIGDVSLNALEKEGDLEFAVRFPDTIYPDPLAHDFSYNCIGKNHAKWLFSIDYYKKSDIQKNKNFALPSEDIKISDEVLSYSQKVIYELEGRATTVVDQYGRRLSKSDLWQGDLGYVKVYRYYEFPSLDYPKGRYAVILPDNNWWFLVKQDELPPPYDEDGIGIVPFVKYSCLKIEGSIYSDCHTTDAYSSQKEYNKLKSLMIEKLKRNQPIFIIDQTSGIDPNRIQKNEVGMFLFKSSMGGGADVQVIQPLQYSPGEERQLLETKANIEDIYHVHEPQRFPPERRTATEFQGIQTYDMMRLLASTQPSKDAELAKIALLFVKHYYTTPRLFKMMGEHNKLEAIAFKGEDLSYADIIVEPTTSSLLSSYIYQQRLLFLAGQGFFQNADETVKLKILKMLNLEEITPMREEEYDEENAMNENWEILNGRLPEPYPNDNDIIHNHIHNIFLKSSKVRTLPKKQRDKIYNLGLQHIELHRIQQLKKNLENELLLLKAKQVADTQIATETAGLPPHALSVPSTPPPETTPPSQPTTPETQPPETTETPQETQSEV